jgi:hypothetical protein
MGTHSLVLQDTLKINQALATTSRVSILGKKRELAFNFIMALRRHPRCGQLSLQHEKYRTVTAILLTADLMSQ